MVADTIIVTFKPNGRFGNNVFQYLATKVIQKYLPGSQYQFNASGERGDRVLTITDDSWDDTLKSLRSSSLTHDSYTDVYYLEGYFQFHQFIEEERDYIQSLFSTHNNDRLSETLTMNTLASFVLNYNNPFTDEDLVVHLRLDDFIMDGKRSAIIHFDSYLTLLRTIRPQFKGKMYIIVDNIKYPFEFAYIQQFAEFNPHILSGHMMEDFARCFWAKHIVLSNSTFCWIPLIFGSTRRHWFPHNVGIFTNQKFDHIDANSILFDTKRLTF
jgi:hypothetical protein